MSTANDPNRSDAFESIRSGLIRLSHDPIGWVAAHPGTPILLLIVGALGLMARLFVLCSDESNERVDHQRRIARDPLAPGWKLRFAGLNSRVWPLLAENPSTPECTIDRILKSRSAPHDVRLAIARRETVTSGQLEMCVNDSLALVRMTIATDARLSFDQLLCLADAQEMMVVRAALRNKNITSAHLDETIRSANPDIRALAATHEMLSPESLDRAFIDSAWVVRDSAVGNPNVTIRNLDGYLRDTAVHERIWPTMFTDAAPPVLEGAGPWVDSGWRPSVAVRIARIGRVEPVDTGTIEAFMVLAELGLTPAQAFWRSA